MGCADGFKGLRVQLILCCSVWLFFIWVFALLIGINSRESKVAIFNDYAEAWEDGARAEWTSLQATVTLAALDSRPLQAPQQRTALHPVVYADDDAHPRDSATGVDLRTFEPLAFEAVLPAPAAQTQGYLTYALELKAQHARGADDANVTGSQLRGATQRAVQHTTSSAALTIDGAPAARSVPVTVPSIIAGSSYRRTGSAPCTGVTAGRVCRLVHRLSAMQVYVDHAAAIAGDADPCNLKGGSLTCSTVSAFKGMRTATAAERLHTCRCQAQYTLMYSSGVTLTLRSTADPRSVEDALTAGAASFGSPPSARYTMAVTFGTLSAIFCCATCISGGRSAGAQP